MNSIQVKINCHFKAKAGTLLTTTKNGHFQVTLTYVDWRSMQAMKRMNVNKLGAGQFIVATFAGSHAIRYFLTTAPFTASADSNFSVNESDEIEIRKTITFN